MHTNVNFGCAQLPCSQSRQAKAFTHHFSAYKCSGCRKGTKLFPCISEQSTEKGQLTLCHLDA